jgi:hypothetical protein
MKTQHTPGPWLVNYAEDRFDSKRSTIEIVDGSYDSLNHEQGPLVLAKLNVFPFAPHMDEPLANACLIASAPELLSALNRLIQSLPEDSNEYPDSAAARQVFDSIAFARAAISKATGGAS